MLIAHSAPDFWLLITINLCGILAAFLAHRATGTGAQNFFQLVALASMAVAGCACLMASGSAPIRCLICGSGFAGMVLVATFDRCGLGLRPVTARYESR